MKTSQSLIFTDLVMDKDNTDDPDVSVSQPLEKEKWNQGMRKKFEFFDQNESIPCC